MQQAENIQFDDQPNSKETRREWTDLARREERRIREQGEEMLNLFVTYSIGGIDHTEQVQSISFFAYSVGIYTQGKRLNLPWTKVKELIAL
jgi:hypothetical protein